MRWKLLLIASALATLVSAGASLALSYGLLDSPATLRNPSATALSILAVPLGVISTASVFVYRHTARRRPLQAAMTAMLSAALTLALITAGSLWLARRTRYQPHAEPPPQEVD